MYYLIRNNYCVKISRNKNELVTLMQSGDVIQYNDTFLYYDDIVADEAGEK